MRLTLVSKFDATWLIQNFELQNSNAAKEVTVGLQSLRKSRDKQ